LVRAEPDIEVFYQTGREDDHNTFVFFEVYSSQAALDFHLQQEYAKRFLTTFTSRLAEQLVRTNLAELP
jgi:quinol monooxygenase YgiN